MSGQQGQRRGMMEEMRQGYNLLTWAAHIHTVGLEQLLRKPGTMGERYPPPIVTLIALFYLPLFACAVGPPGQMGPLLLLGGAALAMAAFHKGARAKMWHETGVIYHSRYKGDSWLRDWGGYLAEAALCLLAGLIISQYTRPLGLYLVFGGFALLFNQQHIDRHDKAMARDLRDAAIEQQLLAEKVRGASWARYSTG